MAKLNLAGIDTSSSESLLRAAKSARGVAAHSTTRGAQKFWLNRAKALEALAAQLNH